jgi:hypothetical protein
VAIGAAGTPTDVMSCTDLDILRGVAGGKRYSTMLL